MDQIYVSRRTNINSLVINKLRRVAPSAENIALIILTIITTLVEGGRAGEERGPGVI